MKRPVAKLQLLVFCLLLFSGSFLTFTGKAPHTILNGVTIPATIEIPTNKSDLMAAVGNGTFFQQAEKVYNERFYYRPFSTKVDKTIRLLSNRPPNTDTILGENHNLLGYEWIYEYLWQEVDYETINQKASDLQFIKSELKKRGKEIIVLITPNKAAFMPEDIPDYYYDAIPSGKTGKRNCDALKEVLEEYGIPCFDCANYMKESAPPEIVQFNRSGIHYTDAIGLFCARELFRTVEQTTGLVMPKFDLEVSESEEVPYPNNDAYDLQNTFHCLTDFLYADTSHQVATIQNLVPSYVRIMYDGGSFLGPYQRVYALDPQTGTVQKAFSSVSMITNTAFYKPDGSLMWLNAITDVDPAEILDSSDLFVFEVNEAHVVSMGFGFIEHMANYLRSIEQ